MNPTLDFLTKRVNETIVRARLGRRTLNTARRNARYAKEDAEDAREAQRIVQVVAQTVQKQAHAKLAGIVTRCLQAVFGPEFEFKIEFDRKRGKTEAKLLITENGLELNPMDECCGGVIDVATFALRLACLLLQRPVRRRLLVLDEPMKNVNGQIYQDRVGQLMETLAEEMGVQFIIVTDDDWLKVGKVVQL